MISIRPPRQPSQLCGIFYLDFFSKIIDITIFIIYYRGSFWIKKLYTTYQEPKINSTRKTPLFENNHYSQVVVFVSWQHARAAFSLITIKNNRPPWVDISLYGGAAGYRPRVQLVSWHSSTSIGSFNLFYNVAWLKNKPKKPSFVTRRKSHMSTASEHTASNITITP